MWKPWWGRNVDLASGCCWCWRKPLRCWWGTSLRRSGGFLWISCGSVSGLLWKEPSESTSTRTKESSWGFQWARSDLRSHGSADSPTSPFPWRNCRLFQQLWAESVICSFPLTHPVSPCLPSPSLRPPITLLSAVPRVLSTQGRLMMTFFDGIKMSPLPQLSAMQITLSAEWMVARFKKKINCFIVMAFPTSPP